MIFWAAKMRCTCCDLSIIGGYENVMLVTSMTCAKPSVCFTINPSQCFSPTSIFHWSQAMSKPFLTPPIQKHKSFYTLTDSTFSTSPPVTEWKSRRRMERQGCYFVRKQEGPSGVKLFRGAGSKEKLQWKRWICGWIFIPRKQVKWTEERDLTSTGG